MNFSIKTIGYQKVTIDTIKPCIGAAWQLNINPSYFCQCVLLIDL